MEVEEVSPNQVPVPLSRPAPAQDLLIPGPVPSSISQRPALISLGKSTTKQLPPSRLFPVSFSWRVIFSGGEGALGFVSNLGEGDEKNERDVFYLGG